MTRHAETEPLAGDDEELLRDLYHERAPAQIELHRAWAEVAPRLTLQSASVRRSHSGGRRFGWRARLGVAAAILALPVTLMGVGFAKENLMPLDAGMQRINDEGLYQYVNQSQTHDGVTVTLTAAYADEGRTVFYYRVQLASELAQRHESAVIGSWNLTSAQGDNTSATSDTRTYPGTCAAWDSATNSTSCYMIQAPFKVGTSASQIALTLDITQVYLPLRAAQGYDTLTGDWRYQFTIPFHHTDVGSSGQFFPHLLHLIPRHAQP